MDEDAIRRDEREKIVARLREESARLQATSHLFGGRPGGPITYREAQAAADWIEREYR